MAIRIDVIGQTHKLLHLFPLKENVIFIFFMQAFLTSALHFARIGIAGGHQPGSVWNEREHGVWNKVCHAPL